MEDARIEEALQACEAALHCLNQWEQNFIASVREQFDREGWLSDSQQDKLEQIGQKV